MVHPDVQVVDENDQPIYGAPFDEVYAKGFHHRVVRISVEDTTGRLLLQKRTKHLKLYPGCWDLAAAGHVDIGETYEVAAKRELYEELGIRSKLTEIGNFEVHRRYEHRIINRFNRVYKIIINPKTKLIQHPDEVDELKWFTLPEVKRLIKDQPDMVADGLTEVIEHFYA